MSREAMDNVAPFVETVFATCELATDVKIILSGSVVKLLDELGAYDVLKCPIDMSLQRSEEHTSELQSR